MKIEHELPSRRVELEYPINLRVSLEWKSLIRVESTLPECYDEIFNKSVYISCNESFPSAIVLREKKFEKKFYIFRIYTKFYGRFNDLQIYYAIVLSPIKAVLLVTANRSQWYPKDEHYRKINRLNLSTKYLNFLIKMTKIPISIFFPKRTSVRHRNTEKNYFQIN